MLVPRQLRAWTLLLGLCVFVPFHLAQSKAKDRMEDDAPGLQTDQARKPLDEHGAPSGNPSFCDYTFHLPWSGRACTPPVPVSPPASQEDLDHLKILLEDTGSILRNLQDAAALESSQSRYQDIVSELLPGIREANSEVHQILQKFLLELEDHLQEDDHPHVADENKKSGTNQRPPALSLWRATSKQRKISPRLQEHLRMMDHVLQVTSRLAQQLDQVSQHLLVTLTKPLEETAALLYRSVLQHEHVLL